MTDIQRAVALHFNISLEDLVGNARDQHLVKARHVAWLLERKRGRVLKDIGVDYNRDHTTILAGLKHMEERVAAGDRRYLPAIVKIESVMQWATLEDTPMADLNKCPTCGTTVAELRREIEAIHRRLTEMGVKA